MCSAEHTAFSPVFTATCSKALLRMLMGEDNQTRIQNPTGLPSPTICSGLCDFTKGCFPELSILTHIFGKVQQEDEYFNSFLGNSVCPNDDVKTRPSYPGASLAESSATLQLCVCIPPNFHLHPVAKSRMTPSCLVTSPTHCGLSVNSDPLDSFFFFSHPLPTWQRISLSLCWFVKTELEEKRVWRASNPQPPLCPHQLPTCVQLRMSPSDSCGAWILPSNPLLTWNLWAGPAAAPE